MVGTSANVAHKQGYLTRLQADSDCVPNQHPRQ